MAEPTDGSKEAGEETPPEPPAPSTPPSDPDWEAEAKRFQSIADKRDAALKDAQTKLTALEKEKDEEKQRDLEAKQEYQKLYEESKAKLEATTAERAALDLRVKLQEFLAENHPQYAPDLKWIAPHVSSEEEIASVTEQYVKAHPRAEGMGTASPGNRPGETGGTEQITLANMKDPAWLDKRLKDDPEFLRKIDSGEISVTTS